MDIYKNYNACKPYRREKSIYLLTQDVNMILCSACGSRSLKGCFCLKICSLHDFIQIWKNNVGAVLTIFSKWKLSWLQLHVHV